MRKFGFSCFVLSVDSECRWSVVQHVYAQERKQSTNTGPKLYHDDSVSDLEEAAAGSPQEPFQQPHAMTAGHPDEHIHLDTSRQLHIETQNAQAANGLQDLQRQQHNLHGHRSALVTLAATPFLGTYAENVACTIITQHWQRVVRSMLPCPD